MKKLPLLLLSIFMCLHGFSQNATEVKPTIIDSLKLVLEKEKHDTSKVEQMLNIVDAAYDYGDIKILKEYSYKALKLSKKAGYKKGIASSYNRIGVVFYVTGGIDSAIYYFSRSGKLQNEIGDYKGFASTMNNTGYIAMNTGKLDTALHYFAIALDIRRKHKFTESIPGLLNNMGLVYEKKGQLEKAVQYFTESLDLKKEAGDLVGIGHSYTGIAFVAAKQKKYQQALTLFQDAYNSYEKAENLSGMTETSQNIGMMYDYLGDHKKALEKYEEGMKLAEEQNDVRGSMGILNSMGAIYNDEKDYRKGLDYFQRSLKIARELDDMAGVAYISNNIAKSYQGLNDPANEIKYSTEAYELGKKIGDPDIMQDAALTLSISYNFTGNYKKALAYHIIHTKMKDSLISIKNMESMNELSTIFETKKKEFRIKTQQDSILIQQSSIIAQKSENARITAEKERQTILLFSFIGGFLIIGIFAIIIFRNYKEKKKMNVALEILNHDIMQKNEEITSQRDEITAQRDLVQNQKEQIENLYTVAVQRKNLVEAQKEEIEDSIRYAKRIQTAMLPVEQISTLTGLQTLSGFEAFILFRPKDVVSGDFYWAAQTEDWTVITVADCTGHGVPGAFMSMLGVSFLNEIVRKKDVTSSAMVLNHLRAAIIEALRQTGDTSTSFGSAQDGSLSGLSDVKDGMDMSIIAIHKDRKRALWAGANNPLWIIRSPKNLSGFENLSGLGDQKKIADQVHNDADQVRYNEYAIIEFKPEKMPVAVHIRMDDFTNHAIELNTGDLVYLFTDGFPDQFGGEKGKKFKYKPFKHILEENCRKPMREQKEALEIALDAWMSYRNLNDGKPFGQIDDITVIGFKI